MHRFIGIVLIILLTTGCSVDSDYRVIEEENKILQSEYSELMNELDKISKANVELEESNKILVEELNDLSVSYEVEKEKVDFYEEENTEYVEKIKHLTNEMEELIVNSEEPDNLYEYNIRLDSYEDYHNIPDKTYFIDKLSKSIKFLCYFCIFRLQNSTCTMI